MERGEEADSEAGPRLAGPGEEALHVVQVEMVRQLPKWIPLTRVKQEPAEELLPQSWEAQWQDFLSAIQSSHPGMGRPQRPEVAPWGDTEMTLVHVENPTVNSLQAREKQVVQWVEDRPGPVEQALSPLGSREGRDDGKGKEESQHMLSPEEERLQFRHFAYEEAGAPQEAYSQLHKRCHRWLRPEKQTKERILDILILEQFLTVLPQEMQEWVAESSPETCAQAVALAERFLLRQRDSKRQDEKVSAVCPRTSSTCSLLVSQIPGRQGRLFPGYNERVASLSTQGGLPVFRVSTPRTLWVPPLKAGNPP